MRFTFNLLELLMLPILIVHLVITVALFIQLLLSSFVEIIGSILLKSILTVWRNSVVMDMLTLSRIKGTVRIVATDISLRNILLILWLLLRLLMRIHSILLSYKVADHILNLTLTLSGKRRQHIINIVLILRLLRARH